MVLTSLANKEPLHKVLSATLVTGETTLTFTDTAITNNVMYIRNEAGELVPISMIASGADQAIAAINTVAANAMAAIEAKTNEQLARIPEVTSDH